MASPGVVAAPVEGQVAVRARGVTSEPAPPPTSPPRPRESRFRPDIEGLRGIAVLLVVWYHTRLGGMPGGFIGVDVFFVISGYLITGLLVAEVRRTGRIDLAAFYARRMRRLLPAAVLTILVTLSVGSLLLAPQEQGRASTSAMAASLYLSNVRFIAAAGNYFAAALETDPFLHTWSLAVEEQFYLFWPLLVLVALRGQQPAPRLVVVLATLSVLSFLGCVWLSWRQPLWAFYGSPTRAWEFGVGAAGALLPARWVWGDGRAGSALGWAGLALILGAGCWITAESHFPGLVALLPALGSVVVLVACAPAPTRGVGRLLAVRPLQHVGELSYSWYLWHWPFLVLAQAVVPGLGLGGRLACSAASLGVAAATHRLLENPIRFHPRLVARAALGLALGVALTLCGAAVSRIAHNLAYRQSVRPEYAALNAAAAPGELPECAEMSGGNRLLPCGDLQPDSTPTVVVFGDSHAGQWAPALRPLALAQGWRLVLVTKSACPASYIRIETSVTWDPEFARHCEEWRQQAVGRIARLKPDLVVLAQSREHVLGLRRKDNRPRATPREWQAGTGRVLEELRGSTGSILLIRDTPRLGVDVPLCLGRALKQQSWHRLRCDSERWAALDEAVFQAERRAATGFAAVSVVDPSDAFCGTQSCYATIDGVVAYSDMDHISSALATRMAPLLRRWIAEADRSGRLLGGAGARACAGSGRTCTGRDRIGA